MPFSRVASGESTSRSEGEGAALRALELWRMNTVGLHWVTEGRSEPCLG